MRFCMMENKAASTSAFLRAHTAFIVLLILLLAGMPAAGHSLEHEPMLPQVYDPGIPVSGWWMSEKFDGVRAYWDGDNLYSKNGVLLHPPEAFTAALPPFALEGELWGGHGTFEKTISIVLRQQEHPRWLELRYAVFDVPHARGTFEARMHKAGLWFEAHGSRYAFLVPQLPVKDAAHMAAYLDEVVRQGAKAL